MAVLRVVFLAFSSFGFLLHPTFVALSTERTARRRCTCCNCCTRRDSSLPTFLPFISNSCPSIFPIPSLPARLPFFPSSTHAVTRSAVSRRQDLTFHSVPVLAELSQAQRVLSSAFTFQPPICHQTHTHNSDHSPPHSFLSL